MRKFLWSDYFHDSLISDVAFQEPSKPEKWKTDALSLTLYCDRDFNKACQEIPEKDYPKDWLPKDWFKVFTSGKFTYILTFYDVQHFEIKSKKNAMTYLNGRFKDSRIVRELNADSKTPYYHFRIQIIWGYIDIVFRKLKIRKADGRVNYAVKWDDSTVTSSQKPFGDPEYLLPEEADDFDCFFTMRKLYADGDPALATYARNCLKSDLPVEDAKPYAAYLLGKVGEKTDLDLIRALYFQTKDELQKRHISDAIEALESSDEKNHT